uniref:Coiled-coil domain containing 30 n=1 Tax=Anser brachyrhynchus TaxID=132585 RepID=A0A8B9BNP7_9AVES
VAHKGIRRLTDELDTQKKEQSKIRKSRAKAVLVSSLCVLCPDRTALQKAMEHNSRLDKEILALRARVQTLDLERKAFLDLVEQLKEEICEYQKGEKQGFSLSTPVETEELSILSEERFQQQEEKVQQLRQDLRRVQNLCSSAERELRYEREKNIDLQKQNLLLQQECTKVKAELKQARAKLSDATETCSSLSAQLEKSQQKVKKLEQELLKCSHADKLQSSLQEKLAQEKSKVYEAQKQISKLHQKLKDSQHQLLLAETRVSDKKLLEEELKEARENEARVQQELREELLKRYPELGKTCAVSGEEVCASQQITQKDFMALSLSLCLFRKYNEMQLRHKDKIRRAKETFIHEVKQRDSRIKQLESELSESKLQVEKGKVLIAQITTENEKLLQERRRLLQKITDQEETPWSTRSTIAALQSRVLTSLNGSYRVRCCHLPVPGIVG